MNREDLKTKCEALASSGDAQSMATLELMNELAEVKIKLSNAQFVLSNAIGNLNLALTLGVIDAKLMQQRGPNVAAVAKSLVESEAGQHLLKHGLGELNLDAAAEKLAKDHWHDAHDRLDAYYEMEKKSLVRLKRRDEEIHQELDAALATEDVEKWLRAARKLSVFIVRPLKHRSSDGWVVTESFYKILLNFSLLNKVRLGSDLTNDNGGLTMRGVPVLVKKPDAASAATPPTP